MKRLKSLLNLLQHPPLAPLAAITLFSLWGCLLIYTAKAFGNNPAYFAGRQLIWLGLGSVIFCITAMIPFQYYERYARWGFSGAVLILVGVLIFGKKINGMTGWFEVANDILFQPSEFAKCTLVLYLCSKMGKKDWDGKNWRSFLSVLIPALVCCALVILEPDLGSALVIAGAVLIVLFLAGCDLKYIFLCMGGAAVAAVLFLWMRPYAMKRLTDFFSSNGESWHLQQFLYTLARGGWTGSEDGGAIWANAYLPLPHTDSLYATIVEAAGFVGGLIVLGLFVLLGILFHCLAQRDNISRPAALYINAIGMLYLLQALLHISVNLVLIPTTGITLPLLSYGGSSLVSTLIAFGIAFSAIRSHRTDADAGDAAPEQSSGSA